MPLLSASDFPEAAGHNNASLPPRTHTIAAGEALTLEGSYHVYFGDKPCGKVQVLRQGLYYLFVCRCQLTGGVVCRLQVVFSEGEQNLGVLTPMDDGFGLRTKLPVKRFSGSPLRFCICAKTDALSGSFTPIYPEEPFSYLEKLKTAYLVKRNGQLGVIIK